MFRKLTLAAAAGAGYVLGTKAGKERYDQIEAKFRELAGMPAVQNATETVKQTASGVADSAKAGINEKVESAGSSSAKSSEPDMMPVVGPSTPPAASGVGTPKPPAGGTSSPKPPTGGASTPKPAPMTGAAASGSAPDVI